MSGSIEGDFYYGLVAQGYDYFLSGTDFGDFEFYRDLIRADGRPALELACGTGRLLLPLLESGLNVHGLDPSHEMLRQCREKIDGLELSTLLHRQSMQALNLEHRYGIIFAAVGSFSLLVDEAEVDGALAACRDHLLSSGQLVLTLHDFYSNPESGNELEEGWLLRREEVDPHGQVWRAYEKVVSEHGAPVVVSEWRYELLKDGKVVGTQAHDSRLRSWTAEELEARLSRAGFKSITSLQPYSDRPAEPAARDFVALAQVD